MISRTNRFHGYNALRFVYANGQTVRGQLFAVRYVVNPKRHSYRAAVVVSKKVHKSAVVRARIRRRLYEIIRLNGGRITQPYDIVLTVFSETTATVEAAKLRAMVVEQLEKAQVLLPGQYHGQPRGIVDKKKEPST